MLTVKMTAKFKHNNLKKLLRRVEEVGDSYIETGYFGQQGNHPTAVHMSYVDLAKFHSVGAENIPRRDVRPLVIHNLESNRLFCKKLAKPVMSFFKTGKDLDKALEVGGIEVTNIAKGFFGDTNYLLPNSDWWAELKGKDTPLVDEGYLRDAWSFMTSELPTVRGT